MDKLESKKFVSTLKMICSEYNLDINEHQLNFFLKNVISEKITDDERYLHEMQYFENYK